MVIPNIYFQTYLKSTPEGYNKFLIFTNQKQAFDRLLEFDFWPILTGLDGYPPEQIEFLLTQAQNPQRYCGVFCSDQKTNKELERIFYKLNIPYIETGWKLLHNKDYLLSAGREDDFRKHIRRFLDQYISAPAERNHRLIKTDFLSALAQQAEAIRIKGFPMFSRSMKIRPQVSIVVAADTGGGKSSFALNLAHALNKEYPVLYFNIEMAERIVYERLLAIESGLTLEDIGKFGNSPELAKAVDEAASRLTSREPFFLYNDKYKLSEVEQIISATPKEDDKPLIVFIDHLHLMSLEGGPSGNGTQSLYEKTTELAKALKQIAKRENIVLFLLAQQNRSGKSENKKPTLASLKDSGELENSADKVVFLWEKMTETLVPQPEAMYLLIAKNREGRPGEEIEIKFDRDTQRIAEKAEFARSWELPPEEWRERPQKAHRGH